MFCNVEWFVRFINSINEYMYQVVENMYFVTHILGLEGEYVTFRNYSKYIKYQV